jgi:hypothetical protein
MNPFSVICDRKLFKIESERLGFAPFPKGIPSVRLKIFLSLFGRRSEFSTFFHSTIETLSKYFQYLSAIRSVNHSLSESETLIDWIECNFTADTPENSRLLNSTFNEGWKPFNPDRAIPGYSWK